MIEAQVEAQVAGQLESGEIGQAEASQADSTLTSAVSDLRDTGKVPSDLPFGLSNILSPSTALFLHQADQYDPAALAQELSSSTAVLVSCSDADLQISCSDAQHLFAGLTKAGIHPDFVHLTDVDHVLKVDPTGAAANYTKALPFSPQLQSSLGSFVRTSLG